ncbi:hypothetical protein [Thalassobacillus sp. C254]|uniref:hypothetical protein n=1 Tax=Thalassobacillus sp. C254 TaxID=1225341 RepID=UPI0006D196E2|nr:hypothetical protein [Thalassobacillus sp. C254]
MYQSLYTAEIEGFEDEFKEVSSEWRFVLANDGEVISLNDEAARWFQRGTSFFLHLDEEECKKAIILLKSIFLQGKIFEFNLTHQFDSHIFTVSYNGKYKNGKFFLLGSCVIIQSQIPSMACGIRKSFLISSILMLFSIMI